MESTVARERAWRGSFRIRECVDEMRVVKNRSLESKYKHSTHILERQKGSRIMSASPLLRTLFGYQAWANSELLNKMEGFDPERHKEEFHSALRLINHAHIVSQIFAAANGLRCNDEQRSHFLDADIAAFADQLEDLLLTGRQIHGASFGLPCKICP